MDVYLVGGAVRDQLLGLPIKDRDWVVVGATADILQQQGYQQVGRNFPIFLHPETKEEYALARQERKSGTGYTGFICNFSPNVSLEQDLLRRDISINAIAQAPNGDYIDPYQGIPDLNNRLLRHVSPAFVEDPLRVLRVARFAARFHQFGFTIANETLSLMQQLSRSGELQQLSAERIWLETEKALLEKNPEIYFEVLRQVGALAVLMPELNALYGVPNPMKHHPEVDSFIHTMLVLQQAVLLSSSIKHQSAVRFATICHDLGKGITPEDLLPHHYGHEKKGIALTRKLCKRLKVPTYHQELAELTCEYHTHVHKALELRPDTILALFNRFDVWRKPERFEEFLLACLADSRGRTGFEQQAYPQKEYLWQCYRQASLIDVKQIIAEGFEKQGIREELNKRRKQAISQVKNTL